MDEKIEEIKTKIEEKQDKPIEKINKKSACWTPERKQKQRDAMIRLQAQGKGYKGKNTKNDIQEVVKPDEKAETLENEGLLISSGITHRQTQSHLSYYGTIIFMFILSVIIAIVFLIKTGTIKGKSE